MWQGRGVRGGQSGRSGGRAEDRSRARDRTRERQDKVERRGDPYPYEAEREVIRSRAQKDAEQTDAIYAKRRVKEAKQLEKVKGRGRVTEALAHRGEVNKVDQVNVGVSFRTDSGGDAHTTHDRKAIEGMNLLEGIPMGVEPVTLPRGAAGPVTPKRDARPEDLADIDMLYIPGAPTANDTQTGGDEEGRLLNVPQQPVDPGAAPLAPDISSMRRKEIHAANEAHRRAVADHKRQREIFEREQPKYARIKGEHDSRAAYELKLIELARTRGIPTAAICAGSWRLLEAYGGKVETLPKSERDLHKAPPPVGKEPPIDPWTVGHGVDVKPGSMLAGMTGAGEMTNVNSTHWAVASTTSSGELAQRPGQPEGREQDPAELLDVSATASGTEVRSNTALTQRSVEAFETRHGAPGFGIQWHPEGYLPGMLGQDSGSVEARERSRQLFLGLGQAATASARRRRGVNRELGGEARAFESLSRAVAEHKEGRGDEAGALHEEALSFLPKHLWSARMDELGGQLEQ